MEKIIKISLILLCTITALDAQLLSDKEAILQRLQGKNIDGKYTWRPKDRELKKLEHHWLFKK